MRGPLLKIERANHHISQLEIAFSRYIEANLKAMRGKMDPNTGKWISQLGLALPDVTALIIGDAIHNLRVSLDHAYWIMVENNGGVWADRIKFPFFGDRPSAEGSINGQPPTSRPSRAVLDYIFGELEPFPGGKLALYDLHRLDITDKHQLLLPTKLRLSIGINGEVRIWRGGPQPQIMTSDGTSYIVFDADTNLMLSEVGPIEYTGDLQEGLVVLFGNGPLGDNGVIETLRSLSKNCHSAVKGLAALMI